MGLDQWIYKEYNVEGGDYGDNPSVDICYYNQNRLSKTCYTIENIVSVRTQVIHWHGAYAIDKWIRSHSFQNEGDRIYLPPHTLIQLRDICEQVISEPSKALEYLPIDWAEYGCLMPKEKYWDDIFKTYLALCEIDPGAIMSTRIDYYYESSR